MTVRGPGRGTTQTLARPTPVPSRRAGPPAVVVLAGLLAVVACALALALTGGSPPAVAAGLPDAGGVTGWGLRLLSPLSTVAAVGTIGSLVVAAALLPPAADGGLTIPARRAAAAAGRWAGSWAALTVSELLLSASDVAGVPLDRLSGSALGEFASSRPGVALCLVAALAAVVGVGAGAASTPARARALLGVGLLALLPGVLVGHGSAAPGHDLLTSALVVHVLAMGLWTGGLLGLVLHLRAAPDVLPGAVARFSVLALVAYLALAVSGLLAALQRLDASPSAWTSGYGALVTAKAGVLVVLGLLGHRHRRTTIAHLRRGGEPRPFLRLAGAEVLLMGVAIGLASALSRTATSPSAVARPGHGEGHPSLPATVEPLSVAELATAWRPDAIVLLVLGLALAGYAAGVRALRRRGRGWPWTRSLAFVAGILVALVDLCSGVATYAPAVLSVQVTQLLVALLVVPLLLLLGAPVTLIAELSAEGRAARAATGPITGATAACALLLLVYRTPLVEASQRSAWVHLAVLALALVSGLLLLRPVLDPEVSSDARRTTEWTWGMVGVAACLAILAGQLRYGDRLLAADWFLELRWEWVDPVEDQRLAGAVVAAAAVAVLVLPALLGVRRRTA